MTDANKVPTMEEQYNNAAESLEAIVKATLPDLHITDAEKFRKNTDVILALLRRTALEFYKQDQMISDTGKTNDKLLNRVTELTTVRSSQSWSELMAQFSNFVANAKGSEVHPMLSAVMAEILKAQRQIVDQETQIEELTVRRKYQAKALADDEPLEKRITRFKRGIQTMFNSMQSSQKNDMAVPPRGLTKARNTLNQSCLLVDDLLNLFKARGDALIEAGEVASRETELLTATQMERDELKRLNEKLDCNVKGTQSCLDDAYRKFDALLVDFNAKDAELDSLRINYAECLDRLFKAKIMRPEELYSKGALFLPQVTFTPENDGFYEVNPEWHDKVVNDLCLDLKHPADRCTYERILIASAARLHNNNHPVAAGDKQEITVIVAWDAYLSVDRKSPTFSTGKLPLFKPTTAPETMTFSYQADNGWERNEKRDVGLGDATIPVTYDQIRKALVPKVGDFMLGFYDALIKRLEQSDVWKLYVHVRKTWDFEDRDKLKPRVPMKQKFLDYLEGNQEACQRMFRNGIVFAGNYMIEAMLHGGFNDTRDVSVFACEDACVKAFNDMLHLEMLHWVFVVNDRVVFDCLCPDDVNPGVTDLPVLMERYTSIWGLFDMQFPYAGMDFSNGPRGCTVKVVKEDELEPLLLSRTQPYIGHNLYTISKEFVIWFSKHKIKGEEGLGELYARNDFRTYVSERLKKFIGINILPVLIIDWDASAITKDLNFMCLPLDPYRKLIINQLNDGLHPKHNGVDL